MTVQQRLIDYRRQYEDQLARLQVCRNMFAQLEAELQECKRLGKTPSETLMRNLRDTEAWVDWNEQECFELEIQVKEC